MSVSRILEREEGDHRAGAWRGKGGLHSEGRQVPRKRGRASKESLPRRKKKKAWADEWTQKLSGKICSLGFTPSLAKPEMGNEVGRRRARS